MLTRKSSLYSLLFTIFNDSIGWGIALTIFAPLFFDRSNSLLPAATTDAMRNVLLGILISSYAVTQFFSMPILGALSDYFGRKRVLSWTILGSALSFVLSAIAISESHLPLLFAARLFAGVFSGNSSTAQASIADMSTESSKAKNLSLSGIFGGLAWIVGPPLGGFLSTSKWVPWFNFSTPFWFLAFCFLLNLAWLRKSYVETYEKKERHDWRQEIKDFSKLSKIPRMKGWLITAFSFYSGWFFFILYYPTLFVQEFQFTQQEIGYFSAYLSSFWLSGSLVLNKWLGEKMRPEKAVSFVTPAAAVLLLFVAWKGGVAGWVGAFPFLGVAGTVLWISLMTLVSNLAGRENQGKAFGILQSLCSLALFIAPLCTGVLATLSLSFPLYVGAAILLASSLCAYRLQ